MYIWVALCYVLRFPYSLCYVPPILPIQHHPSNVTGDALPPAHHPTTQIHHLTLPTSLLPSLTPTMTVPTFPRLPPSSPPAGNQEVPLPLPVKDAFHAVVRTCAVSRDGLGSLEEAILQARVTDMCRAIPLTVKSNLGASVGVACLLL